MCSNSCRMICKSISIGYQGADQTSIGAPCIYRDRNIRNQYVKRGRWIACRSSQCLTDKSVGKRGLSLNSCVFHRLNLGNFFCDSLFSLQLARSSRPEFQERNGHHCADQLAMHTLAGRNNLLALKTMANAARLVNTHLKPSASLFPSLASDTAIL